jgi:hypothetical protein
VNLPRCPDLGHLGTLIWAACPAAQFYFVQSLHKARVQSGHDAAMNEKTWLLSVRNAHRLVSNIR